MQLQQAMVTINNLTHQLYLIKDQKSNLEKNFEVLVLVMFLRFIERKGEICDTTKWNGPTSSERRRQERKNFNTASENRKLGDWRDRCEAANRPFYHLGIISQITKLRNLKTQLEIQVESQKTEIQEIQNSYNIERRKLQQEIQEKTAHFQLQTEEMSANSKKLAEESERLKRSVLPNTTGCH